MCTTEKLLERIEFLRNKMTDVALKKGFTSIESITISQELDRLLNLFDDVKQTEHQKSID
ncbi:Spo0E like sporulation regulatory protein [Virgibacillus subterraneus]|uniref:Spo0E like sporulation regulatory protein n=2 Tax=Virgibacillus TaxID=84406 RepID=A0A1H1CM89_9BACI|nr:MULTISPECIES: aspartyl-phosphate phosphatase Spo0E family protein [Virgibacillus]SDQ65317.1 Spo0E like sporulation regulatory protein [Virgibacillus salinus]SEQ63663.1 Spo0E like sporulation regulatory protein [Virgibacillus subterraneus]